MFYTNIFIYQIVYLCTRHQLIYPTPHVTFLYVRYVEIYLYSLCLFIPYMPSTCQCTRIYMYPDILVLVHQYTFIYQYVPLYILYIHIYSFIYRYTYSHSVYTYLRLIFSSKCAKPNTSLIRVISGIPRVLLELQIIANPDRSSHWFRSAVLTLTALNDCISIFSHGQVEIEVLR